MGILLSLSTRQLEEKLPEFYLLLQNFVEQLSVNEQLLQEIGMDLATLLTSSREDIAKRFPIFHKQLELFINRLRVDEKFLNALDISSRDFDAIKDSLAKENRGSVEDLISGFDNMQQIIDRVIGRPSAEKIWKFIELHKGNSVARIPIQSMFCQCFRQQELCEGTNYCESRSWIETKGC